MTRLDHTSRNRYILRKLYQENNESCHFVYYV